MSSSNYGSKGTTPRLYYERKLWGVCILCGKPLRNGETTLSCINCRNKRKQQASARRERVNEQSRELRRKHRAAGLCNYCNTPAIEGRSMCEYHKEYYSKTNQLLRKQRREQAQSEELNQSS